MNRSIIASSISVGFDTLRANPLRTLLSTLGIIMGVGSLVSVLALGDGIERYARSQIDSTTDLQMLSVTPRTVQVIDGQPFPRTDYPVFGQSSIDTLARLTSGHAAILIQATGQALATTRSASAPRAAQVFGVLGDYVAIHPQPLAAGRLLTSEEMRTGTPVVVLSATLAQELAAPRDARAIVGDSVRLQGVSRTVVGVLDAPAGAAPMKVAIVPLPAFADVVVRQGRPTVTTLILKADSVESVPRMRATVEGWLAAGDSAWKERAMVASQTMRLEQAQQGIFLFKLLMGALTGISLLVGGIGIMNVLLASVVERTREIGIRKAAGAQQRHILFQFLSESVTISGVGSLLGVALGVAVAFAATAVMRSLTQARVYAGFSVSTFLVGVTASVLVGLLFGLYPALRAARLSPIEAIHHE